MVSAVDHGDGGRGQGAAERGEGLGATVRVRAAGHDEPGTVETRRVPRLPCPRGQRRGNEGEAGQALAGAGHGGGHRGPEGVAGQREPPAWRQPLAQQGERRADVVLLARALVPGAAGAADAAEVEAQGREAGVETRRGDREDHGVVHVAPVEGVGVANDHARQGFRGHRERALEREARACGDGHGLSGYHQAQRIARGGPTVQPLC